MFVRVEALLNVGRALGRNNFDVLLPEGFKLSDLLKAIKVPGKGTVYEMMIDENGHLDSHYDLELNDQRIHEDMLDKELKEHDLIIMSDIIHVPGGAFAAV
ncbi:MAG TPA: hypothetical protein P5244_14460 [Syntrophales bacterium]|jgi:hypothetical protein|nr:hypothetical protein [Syntrophales bacterium]HRR42433.1 hypothetical protein [Syntrophales bacterium]